MEIGGKNGSEIGEKNGEWLIKKKKKANNIKILADCAPKAMDVLVRRKTAILIHKKFQREENDGFLKKTSWRFGGK